MNLKLPPLALPKSWEQMQSWFFAIPQVEWQGQILTKILDYFLAPPFNLSLSQIFSQLSLPKEWNGEALWQKTLDDPQTCLLHRGRFFSLFQQFALHPITAPFDLMGCQGGFRDLRGVTCPNNLAKAQVEIAKLPRGIPMELWIDPGAPIENVPRGLIALGVEIQSRQKKKSLKPVPCQGGKWSPAEFWVLQLKLPSA